jgi:DnaJ-class molecular chaperone
MPTHTLTGFRNAWRKPVPPSATCIHCKGGGLERHPFSGREKTCHICGGRGLTSPPIDGITPCDACEGDGKRVVYEFEHMTVDCWKCGGRREIVSQGPWDPLPWGNRLLAWLQEGDCP